MHRDHHALEDLFYRHIPITKVLGIHVASYDGIRLVLRAPLTVNANHYGTAFAGSIGALLVLGGLAIIRLKLADMGFGARIMMTRSRITYARPVTTDIEVFCELASQLVASRMRRHLNRQDAINVKIGGGVKGMSGMAVKYSGLYAIRALTADDINQGDCLC